MITNFNEIDSLASDGKPVPIAVMGADEKEVLLTVKISMEKGFVKPCLIGNRDRIKEVSDKLSFDISSVEIIEEPDPQRIADRGVGMLFSRGVDIAIKGHITTSFIYRSIIKHERSSNGLRNISVNTLWDIHEVDHLITITDTGVNINPDCKTKKSIIMNAVNTMKLLGYNKPRVAVISAYNGINTMLDSFLDAKELNVEISRGYIDDFILIEETSIAEILLGINGHLDDINKINLHKLPHIIVVPHLDAGNIFSKLDFMLDVVRRSFVMSSRGPVIIPSRSDTHEFTTGEVAMGVVVSRLLKGSGCL